MKTLSALLLSILVLVSCSLAPEKPFTKEQLYKTGIYTYFAVNDSPESVLSAINKDGEVILSAKYRNRDVWIKLLGKLEGITVQIIEK
ncbi:MAG: hypothetical protein PHN84_08290 [Desulfuromonadaceae bacterium]|nr:hypothetical protein [Desulfuromonadaceae bacterium]MDD2855655.1 hypothetical protein [Desulfuromonadaceae bacterium]